MHEHCSPNFSIFNSNKNMKKHFITTICSLLSVLVLIIITNYIVDPFNRNNYFDFKLHKDQISFTMNDRLYKMIEFKNNPGKHHIGDSRSRSLKSEYFEMYGVKNMYNFGYGGGSLYEVIDSFWYATSLTKLETVIIGIPFNILMRV